MAPKKSAASAVEALGDVLEAVDGLEPEDQRWVFTSVLNRLQLQLDGSFGTPTPPGPSGGGEQATRAGGSQTGGSLTASEFFRQKKPKTDIQKVACLAYYLTHNKNVSEFKGPELQDVETEARTAKITKFKRALDNATRGAKVLTTTSGGSKQLTTHGEDIVNALPDQEAVREVQKALGGTRKRTRRTSERSSKKA